VGGFLGGFFVYVFGFWLGTFWVFRLLPLIIGAIAFLSDMGSRQMNERTGYRWFVPQGALVWMGIEMIRYLIPGIGTGGFIGYSFFRAPWLIQTLSITGIFGLDLLAITAAYTLGLAGIYLFDKWLPGEQHASHRIGVPRNLQYRWLVGVGCAAFIWTALSAALYLMPLRTKTLSAAAVQPADRSWSTLETMTRDAAARGAELVVMPEGALQSDPQTGTVKKQLTDLAAVTDTYLAVGSAYLTDHGQKNEVSIVSTDGMFVCVYGKDHPLTMLGETSVSRGRYPAAHTPLGGFGGIICYDLEFTDSARKVAAAGAEVLAVPSNDWPVLAGIQRAYVVFRAIENRVAVIKADTRYDSMIVDPKGRIVTSLISTKSVAGTAFAEVPIGSGPAIYTRLGDWLGWVCLLGFAFFLLPNPLLKGTSDKSSHSAGEPRSGVA
jgi:apolipoprotein N-acyltransferase